MNLFNRIRRKFANINATRKPGSVIKEWEKAGKPLPPPHLVKQLMIKEFQSKYNYQYFVETGTYLGEMVEAQKHNFSKVISIELGWELYLNAIEKFKNYSHISILHGDSGVVLNQVCAELNNSAIFWLDGHYSAGITAKGDKFCPIFEELSAIFNSHPYHHLLLIDDARLFTGEDDYPTSAELSAFIQGHRPNATISYENDIILVTV